jgi:hypothetical protein
MYVSVVIEARRYPVFHGQLGVGYIYDLLSMIMMYDGDA